MVENLAPLVRESMNSEIYKKHTLSKIYSWAKYICSEDALKTKTPERLLLGFSCV